jgi:thiamine-monophosphate kinase
MGLVARGGMVHRSGGQAGDALYVSGEIGGSTAGLALRQGRPGTWDSLADDERAALLDRYRLPQPRVALAAAIAQFASAAMDVSDGLVGDCDKLAEASACGAEIEAERVPLPHGLAGSRTDAETMAALLTGGEDFEILAAIPPDREARFRAAAHEAKIPVERIGRLVPGPGPTRVTLGGKPLAFARRSFVHAHGAPA